LTIDFQPDLDFEAAEGAADDGEALIIDIDGFEGPLHMLLALARAQKVDLLKLSITKLVDQYLAFVREARRRRFSLAADYLVMAAWLAYLKSRLLLPKVQREGPGELPAEQVAELLAFRLAKLDAMRRAGEALQARAQLGREVFTRGDPEQVKVVPSRAIEGDLYGLMQAYISQRRKDHTRAYSPPPAQSYPLDEARERLKGLLAELQRWTPLAGVAPIGHSGGGPSRASFLASTLSASLELVKDGELEARQLEHFADIYLRARPTRAA
jgi:segregation and condensation protein A